MAFWGFGNKNYMGSAEEENDGKLYTPYDLCIRDEGMGTVEVILIIVVLIGLVLIFKKQIRGIVETIMNKITADSDSIMS